MCVKMCVCLHTPTSFVRHSEDHWVNVALSSKRLNPVNLLLTYKHTHTERERKRVAKRLGWKKCRCQKQEDREEREKQQYRPDEGCTAQQGEWERERRLYTVQGFNFCSLMCMCTLTCSPVYQVADANQSVGVCVCVCVHCVHSLTSGGCCLCDSELYSHNETSVQMQVCACVWVC